VSVRVRLNVCARKKERERARERERERGGEVPRCLVLGLVLALFLHLHSPVLEPDLHLPLRQVERARHLMPPVPREVHVEQELLLQLQRLVFGVRATLLPGGARVQPVGRRVAWRQRRRREGEGRWLVR